MKSAKQVREYVRRRCLEEREDYLRFKNGLDAKSKSVAGYARVSELAFIEVLNAFDTPHKMKLDMPPKPKASPLRKGLK